MQQTYVPATLELTTNAIFFFFIFILFAVVEKDKKHVLIKYIIFISNTVKYYFPIQIYHVISVPVSKLNQFSH